MDASQIGMRIRDLRHECGFTQEALAEEASLSVSYLSHIEHGKKRASLAALVQIASALRTTVDYLVGGERESDTTRFVPEIYMLLQDCSDTERRVILSTSRALKYALRYEEAMNDLS